ncbi:transposase [Bradyrhizobium sp. CW9]|nr:transposase [Bradyrhizobium sp. CW9]
MKRSRFSEEQTIGILSEHWAYVTLANRCRKHGVSEASINKWTPIAGGWSSRRPRLETLAPMILSLTM